MDVRERIFKVVLHREIEEYLLLGWVMTDIFMGHVTREYYSVCMEWLCDCPARTLRKEPPRDPS